MMRSLMVLMLLVGGCTDGAAPPFLSTDLSGSVDMTVVVDQLGADLLDVDALTACTTACGCPAGQQCQSGFCRVAAPMVFCCTSGTCPSDNLCQLPTGQFSQCGAAADAGAVGADGGAATCPAQSCIPGLPGNALCVIACGATGATCAGSPPRCQP